MMKHRTLFLSWGGAMIALLLIAMLTLVTSDAYAAWQTPGAPTQQLAAQQDAPPPGLTATVSDPYYKITAADVSAAIATQLQQQAVVPKAEVTLTGGTPAVLYTADHALQVVIHALQIDPSTKRWQAQAYIMTAGKTEVVKPVSGFYGTLIDVPVLVHQVGQREVIEAADLTIRSIPERLLRKDTVTDSKELIGKSPRSIISADRPIRAAEISSPVVIKRGETVELTYTTKYMHIKTTGVALQDGAKDALIRVKNDKSEKAVSGRVVAAGHVEVNDTTAM